MKSSLGTVCPMCTLLHPLSTSFLFFPVFCFTLRFVLPFSALGPVRSCGRWSEVGCCVLAHVVVLPCPQSSCAGWESPCPGVSATVTQLESPQQNPYRGPASPHPLGPYRHRAVALGHLSPGRLCPWGFMGLCFGYAECHLWELLLSGGAAATSSCL